MAPDPRAPGEASHPEVPAFVEYTPVDRGEGHISQNSPRVLSILESKALDGSRVLDGVSFAARTAACAAGFAWRCAGGARWGDVWGSPVSRGDGVTISGKE